MINRSNGATATNGRHAVAAPAVRSIGRAGRHSHGTGNGNSHGNKPSASHTSKPEPQELELFGIVRMYPDGRDVLLEVTSVWEDAVSHASDWPPMEGDVIGQTVDVVRRLGPHLCG